MIGSQLRARGGRQADPHAATATCTFPVVSDLTPPPLPQAAPAPDTAPLPAPAASGINPFAIASLICGILGFFGGAPLGLIFGIIAMRQIRRTGQRGSGQAVWGLVLSAIWLVIVLGLVGFVVVLQLVSD